MILSIILLVTLSCGCCVYSACPDQWYKYEDSCYALSSEKMNWPDAQAVCMGHGGHLAVCETRDEREYLISTLRKIKDPENYWIGVSRQFDNVFRWTDGQAVEPMDMIWATGQPNYLNDDDDCATLWYKTYYELNDVSCSAKYKFVCEIKGETIKAVNELFRDQECRDDHHTVTRMMSMGVKRGEITTLHVTYKDNSVTYEVSTDRRKDNTVTYSVHHTEKG